MTQRCFTAITTDSAKHQILHFPLLNVTLEWQYMRSVTNHFHTADQFLLCSYNPRWRPMAGLAFACRLLHSSSITQMLTLLSLQESILLKIQRQRRWVAERARRQEIFEINFLQCTCVWKQRSSALLQHGTLQCFNLFETSSLNYLSKEKYFFKKIGRRKMICLLCLKQCSSKLRGNKIPIILKSGLQSHSFN